MGFLWVYGILVLFSTGVIELVIMPAIEHKLVPTLILSANQTLSDADVTAFTGQVNQTVGYMHMGIYVLMFVVFVYAILSIFTREEQEFYQP